MSGSPKETENMELEIDQGYAGGFSPDTAISTPLSNYPGHEVICTPHTQDSGMDDDISLQDDCDCEIFQNQIKKHWIDLKREINPKTLSEGFARIGWKAVTDVGNNKRSIDAEKLLNEITPKLVSKSHIEQFKNVAGDKIIGILESPGKSQKDHFHSAESTYKDLLRIQNCKRMLEETLLPKHIQEIKDNFLQCNIIDCKENNELCMNPGLYSATNKAIVRQFVDLAIEKAHLGSYQCMVCCIKTLSKNDPTGRLAILLLKLESGDDDKKGNSDGENGNKKRVKITFNTVHCKKESEDSDEGITADITIKFNVDNETTRQLYEVIKDRTFSNLRTFAASNLGLECTNVKKGSVIIHLKSLDGKLRSRLRNSIYNREIEKLLEVIFTNAEVNSLLTPGTFCLEMEVRAVGTVKVKKDTPIHHWDIVADNKSFLVEEIDTEVVAKAFKGHGKYFSDESLQADRYMAAKHIIDKIIQKHWQETFREVLEENRLTYIQQRIITYERVCRADTTYLRQNILTQFPLLLSNFDLNEMRVIFTERGILKKQLFDNIKRKYGDDKENANANFLIAVLRSGSDAMLTLIDALFVLQLDDFANCLLNSKPKDLVCMTKNADLEDICIQWRDNSGEDVIIKGSFSLVVDQAELMETPIPVPVATTPGKRKRAHSSGILRQANVNELMETPRLVPVATSPEKRRRALSSGLFSQATVHDCKLKRDNRKRHNLVLTNCSEMTQSLNSKSELGFQSCLITKDKDTFNISQFADLNLKAPDSDQGRIHYNAFGNKCQCKLQSNEQLSSSYPRHCCSDGEYSGTPTGEHVRRKENCDNRYQRQRLQMKATTMGESYQETNANQMTEEFNPKRLRKHNDTLKDMVWTESFKISSNWRPEDVSQPPIKRPPSPVDPSFRDDVKAWKKIRYETIPRLQRLERELRSADEKIKTTRNFRNFALGCTFFGGLLFTALVGGGYLAAMLSGGTTWAVYFFIFMYIQKEVLETAQEGINKDKAETIRLQKRITSYQGGNTRTEKFVRNLGSIALQAIIQLSQHSLIAFLASFVDTSSMSLLIAIDRVKSYRKQLDKELSQVEEVEGRFY